MNFTMIIIMMIDIKTGANNRIVDEEIDRLQKKVAEKYGYNFLIIN